MSLRAGAWSGTAALVVLGARMLAYALAPAPTEVTFELQRSVGGPRLVIVSLCSIGLAAFIGFQALVNIGGITRALPMTGITLPFVSHGGFSLITSFAMLGMLMAFSHRNAQDARVVSRITREPESSIALEAVE